MSDKKLKRRLNAFFRLLIILSICVITVYLFPKVGSFQYEYQKGMPWRYETLTAPFDFPIHKTEDELQEEREKLVQEQSPIFILNTNTADLQTGKFRTALHAFRNETTSGSLNKLTDRLKDIYTAGIVAIFSLSHLQRRSQLILSIFLIFITYTLVYMAFILTQEGEIRGTHLFALIWLAINCLLLTLTYPVIYIFERIFGYTSEITLIELSNPNHPALRNLTKKAPGTFQHSLMVANLAEEAIYRIGGNPLLTRTGALYHDIGKTFDPIFFIENQSGGINPHDQCEFDVSAQHIIDHVRKGVEMAKKYNLPEGIINFIRTHHGKSKVKYFYNSFKNKYPDREIDESLFTYDGPDPVSRECAVVMMADAVEAVSRTLVDKTEENITKVVNNIIDGQLQDGRYANADITFKDIATVKKVFIEMLTNIYHSRIAYPKLKQEEKK